MASAMLTPILDWIITARAFVCKVAAFRDSQVGSLRKQVDQQTVKKSSGNDHQTGVNWAVVMPYLIKNKLVRYGTKPAVNDTHQGGAR